MQAILIYLLKVIICSGLLLAYYWLVLRNKQFHQYNRFYLLFAVLLSIVLPLVQLEWFTLHSRNEDTLQLLQTIYAARPVQAATPDTVFTRWQFIGAGLFALISIAMLGMLTTRVITLYRLRNRYSTTHTSDGFLLINTDLPQAPFSFLNWLFWRNDITLNSADGSRILQHELAHITQKHTWDKLFMQVILSVYWINPFFWLLQKELSMIHEFIADQKAIQDKDSAAFASMLLYAHAHSFNLSPAQSFFHSPIKRRLAMLTTSKQPRYDYIRRLMVLPVAGLVTLLFAFRVQGISQSATPKHTEKRDTLQLKAVVVEGYKKGQKPPPKPTKQVKPLAMDVHKQGDSIPEASIEANEVVVEGYKLAKSKNTTDAIEVRKDTAGGKVNRITVVGKEARVAIGKKLDNADKSGQGEPLYIIDGKTAQSQDIKSLSPNTIQSIDVLKGEAAIAVYGQAGANGVIIIKTKSANK